MLKAKAITMESLARKRIAKFIRTLVKRLALSCLKLSKKL